jgi:hypothetical protein
MIIKKHWRIDAMERIANIIVPVAIMFSAIVAVWVNLAAYRPQIKAAILAAQNVLFGCV